jgi:cell volume regulation protein A
MREVEVLPWSVDVRFRTSPDGVEQQVVEAGSEADGATVLELCSNADGWVSIIVRSGHNIPVRDSTRLEAGDVVLTHSTSPEVFRRRFSGG